MADNVIAGASAADAVLVVVDNLYMYGPSRGPMTEETPRRASGAKGQLRVRLEEKFLAAHAEGRVGIAIGRGSDFYGPHANSAPDLQGKGRESKLDLHRFGSPMSSKPPSRR